MLGLLLEVSMGRSRALSDSTGQGVSAGWRHLIRQVLPAVQTHGHQPTPLIFLSEEALVNKAEIFRHGTVGLENG